MAHQQPPPRKGGYNKIVSNVHKDQLANIQAKNQQELDMLDDIKGFMKQKATLEKNYAEGLLKLSSVYSTKKIACKVGLELNQSLESGDQNDGVGDQNIYKIWKKILEENEKIANLRLAAAQVFQENISDDAKNLRATKSVQAKKYLDRFITIQKDVQVSVGELDQTRFTYFSEESDAIRVANRAEEAELKAKGKKKDVMSIFQSKTALEKQAGKLCAKQEELNIKSTGARNDYLLALETANAHQERYFHFDLKKTLAGMEGNVYEKISEYLATLATTELATCNAAHGSFSKIKDQSQSITRDYNYQCYLKTYTSLSEHLQYNFEPVQGDSINIITMPEDDAGISYALNREAREAAEKYNNAIKMVSAFRKRINALHKAKKKMDVPDPSLDEKIEELDNSIDNAECDKAKADAKLKKLREGGVSVDKYLDAVSVGSDANREDVNDDWDVNEDVAAVPEVNYFSYDEISYTGEAVARETTAGAGDASAGWGGAATNDWTESQFGDPEPSSKDNDWGTSSSGVGGNIPSATKVLEKQEAVKATVLYLFSGENDDELPVNEGEEILIMVDECDEDGWIMAQNLAGKKGLVPSSFVQVLDQNQGECLAQPTAQGAQALDIKEPVLVIPSCPPPDTDDDSSSEEESEEDDMPPPGLAPPPGPPPQLSPTPPGSFLAKSLYDFASSRSDELSLSEGDVVLVTSRTPNGDEDGWWLGQLDGKTGLFPSNYVEECKQEENENASKNQDSNDDKDTEENKITTDNKECPKEVTETNTEQLSVQDTKEIISEKNKNSDDEVENSDLEMEEKSIPQSKQEDSDLDSSKEDDKSLSNNKDENNMEKEKSSDSDSDSDSDNKGSKTEGKTEVIKARKEANTSSDENE